jgi:hypothetical protein
MCNDYRLKIDIGTITEEFVDLKIRIVSARVCRIWSCVTTEPHRVFRRPFGLSYAAMAGASSMA